MGRRLIIDGNAVYEIDESCMRKKQEKMRKDTTAMKKKTKNAKKI
ncbi:MAG: hypothetical protein Q4E24_00670 [bacterium]|nr:hypothetical protein [bacterium]